MERKAHYLKAPAGNWMPGTFAVLQAELFTHKPTLSDLVYEARMSRATLIRWRANRGETFDRRVVKTGGPDNIWREVEALTKHGKPLWLLSYDVKAHAAACGLWDLLERGEATFDGADDCEPGSGGGKKVRRRGGYAVLEGPPAILQFRLAGCHGSVTWVDLQNYGIDNPYDIATGNDGEPIGAARAVQHEQDWGAFDGLKAEWLERWLVRYVWLVIAERLGSLQTTAASQALHAWKHRFNDDWIHVHDNAAVLNMERQASYSGRNECFRLGTFGAGESRPTWDEGDERTDYIQEFAERYTHYDVNSLYPAVARDGNFPTILTGVYDRLDVPRLLDLCKHACCVSIVKVETAVPCVPMRLSQVNLTEPPHCGDVAPADYELVATETIYPVGRFWTSLCGPEIWLAAREGLIADVGQTAVYAPQRIFTSYVDAMWSIRMRARDAGDKAGEALAKRMLNALYGKFSQRSKRWIDRPDEICHRPYHAWWQRDEDTGEVCQWRSLAWKVQQMVTVGEHPESCPAINAYVMSYARVRLWELILTAGRQNVYYCDTDSLFVNESGRNRLEAAGEVSAVTLGKLKEVGVYDAVSIRGLKHYKTADGLTCAGLTGDASFDGNGNAVIQKDVPVDTFLWRGQTPKAWTHEATLPLSRSYRHGIPSRDGRVHPLGVYCESILPFIPQPDLTR